MKPIKSSSTQAARVVASLNVLKWIIVALWALWALGAVEAIWKLTEWPIVSAAPVVLVAAVSAWVSWAAVGWLQHMLGMAILSAKVGAGIYLKHDNTGGAERLAYVTPRGEA
jgi:hypothetical protein